MQKPHNSMCPNCFYVYPGSYCPECGLERHAALEKVRAANRRNFKGVIIANLACLPSMPYILSLLSKPSQSMYLLAVVIVSSAFAFVLGTGILTFVIMVRTDVRSRHAYHALMIAIVTGWCLHLFWVSQGDFFTDLQREALWAVTMLRKSM